MWDRSVSNRVTGLLTSRHRRTPFHAMSVHDTVLMGIPRTPATSTATAAVEQTLYPSTGSGRVTASTMTPVPGGTIIGVQQGKDIQCASTSVALGAADESMGQLPSPQSPVCLPALPTVVACLQAVLSSGVGLDEEVHPGSEVYTGTQSRSDSVARIWEAIHSSCNLSAEASQLK